VIPVLRDNAALSALLVQLSAARRLGAEVIVVGAHGDASSEAVAQRDADRYLSVARGRGNQLASGARATARPLLWFLHADTTLPDNATRLVCEALHTHDWGRFDVRFDDPRLSLRVVAAMMNWRSRVSGICTGDQGIFLRRSVYEAAGGFAPIALMEDIALCGALRRLPKVGRPACLRMPLVVSARKWQRDGIFRTVVRMWRWRFRYWCGACPETLAREYYRDIS
jgi:rSAM/selenodomain-associated transferase 2